MKWILTKIIVDDGVKLTKSQKTTISLIIRTKNEEKWIGRCLTSVFSQKVSANIEVVLVDNQSTDNTVDVAKRFPISKFISLDRFFPGKALNDGINASSGDYLVCLSSHCIPVNKSWLQTLLNNFNDRDDLAGVYGRQLPLGFTDPIDKRDLLITFGLDKRIQEKDYFFHNANSMIPRNIWKEFPFDEKVTNIEDRVWGKQVIENGYKILYDPDASVYHHHGLHHGNTIQRVKGVVSILENVDGDDFSELPHSMLPKNLNIVSVIPVIGNISNNKTKLNSFQKLVLDIKKSKYVNSIYCISNEKLLADSEDIKWINRDKIKNADKISLNKLLLSFLNIIEEKGDFPDSILYVNYDYLNRPPKIIDELIIDAQYKGCDTIFPGMVDYGHYWYHNDNHDYKQTDPSLKSREDRDALYKALYGLGCLTSSWIIRTGDMIGGKIGIIPLNDPKYSKRLIR